MKLGNNTAFDDAVGARAYLGEVGLLPDAKIDLFESALALSALAHPSIVIDRYRNQFKRMCEELKEKFEENAAALNGDTVAVQVSVLRELMAESYAYIGDTATYDDLQNVDMMRVMDRRTGMPITLCILAISLCRAIGWHSEGINFPGHFLMRLVKDGERAIIDPFQGCREMHAPDLRRLLKLNMGADAELSGAFYEPCTNRDMLMRLQNNIKFRLIESEHYAKAMEVVDVMMMIAPDDIRLTLDMAVLLARLERPKAAVEYLVLYIEKIDNPFERAEAEQFLAELKGQLH